MSAAKGRYFLDTNILVYAWANKDNDRSTKARSLIGECVKNNSAVISTQVLQEFYSVVTVKLGCDKLAAKEATQRFSRIPLVQVDAALIQQAIDISILSQLSFWDSLIIAAAGYANCHILYSEDLNDGQVVRSITIANPFQKLS